VSWVMAGMAGGPARDVAAAGRLRIM